MANIIYGKKTECFLSVIRNQARKSALKLLFNMLLEAPPKEMRQFDCWRQSKEMKLILMGKKEEEPSICTGDKVVYIENPKRFIKELLEVRSKFGRLQNSRSVFKNQLHFCTLIRIKWGLKNFKNSVTYNSIKYEILWIHLTKKCARLVC